MTPCGTNPSEDLKPGEDRNRHVKPGRGSKPGRSCVDASADMAADWQNGVLVLSMPQQMRRIND